MLPIASNKLPRRKLTGYSAVHADGFPFALPILLFLAAGSGELNPEKLNMSNYYRHFTSVLKGIIFHSKSDAYRGQEVCLHITLPFSEQPDSKYLSC